MVSKAPNFNEIHAAAHTHDWLRRYGYTPFFWKHSFSHHLSLVHATAANWIRIAKTAGRGKKCPVKQPILHIKDIWLYPLRKDFRLILRR